MTLLDLCRIMRHYWKVVIAIFVVCVMTSALASRCAPVDYEASATITVADPSNNVSAANMLAVLNDFVQTETASYSAEDSSVKTSVKLGTGTSAQTLTLSVEGADADECVKVANTIAHAAADEAKNAFDALQLVNEEGQADLGVLSNAEDVASVLSGSLLQDVLGTNRTFEFCSFMVTDASTATKAGPDSLAFILVGGFFGLVLSVLVVVMVNAARKPIKGREDLEGVLPGVPVFDARRASSFGDMLWASLALAPDGRIRTVSIVPVGDGSAEICSAKLKAAAERAGFLTEVIKVQETSVGQEDFGKNDITIYQCPSPNVGARALYFAHDSDATIICARAWSDSAVDLRNTDEALSLTGARIRGAVLSSS